MSFLNDLIDEIKENHPNEILVSELGNYFSRYRKYYDENVTPIPRQGFVACWSWDDERKKEFYKVFDKHKIKITEDPIEPLHNYKLEQN